MANKEYKYTFSKFLRDWALIISMVCGAGLYLAYRAMPALHFAGPVLLKGVTAIQPVLLFLMLFLSFCKIELSAMKPHKWMLPLLLIQSLSFVALALLLAFCSNLPFRYGFEAAMLCMICPTATACAVVTGKLGGNMAGVVTYTVIINIVVAILVPLLTPLVYPQDGLNFSSAFLKILAKVFPLLIMPCLLAWIVRYLLPSFHAWLLRYTDLSFYIWAVSLGLAILMSTRAIVHTSAGFGAIAQIALGSLLCCALQFALGRLVGSRYRCRISAAQALGQKNTVFAIWLAYTFFNPVVSVAGGFYSIWHNCYNTYQMYQKRKADKK